MSADKNLIFFDDKGHSLNFNYNESTHKYEGKLIFDHNSAGTFKNIGLNLFEKIDAFQYIDETHISLNKFQLFNHYGIIFQSNTNKLTQIEKIEPTNTDPTFYSKWIYASNIDGLYSVGSKIRFNSNIFEFTTSYISTVVAVKRGAILIISNVDNNTFNTLYGSQINNPLSYTGKTISGMNTLTTKYIFDTSFNATYPSWSEPYFFDKWDNGDKITIVNSKSNDGVYTIKDRNSINEYYTIYKLNSALSGYDLRIDVKLKTDLPLIYTGGLNFNSSGNRIDFLSTLPTQYFKPGLQFQVINSGLNNIFLTVSNISKFNPLTTYVIGDQVIYNNIIYQCIADYTSDNVNITVPTDSTYWSSPDYLIVDETLNNEFISSSLTYLTTNVFSFITPFDTSDEITIASAYQKYKSDLSSLNIDLKWDKINGLTAELIYASVYAEVKYIVNNTDVTSISSNNSMITEIEEDFINENNNDISELFTRELVFTDLDDFGLKIILNKQEYYVDTDFVYIGLNLDLVQTVSNTIKDFVDKYFYDLVRLGIVIEAIYTGTGNSPFVNTIKISTVYPNIPLNFDVHVGSTANFYLNHSSVAFNQIGSVLNVKINGKSYIQLFSSNIATTLSKWHDKYRDILFDFGIIANVVNNNINFSILDDSIKLSYEILVGKSTKPSLDPYEIVKHYTGNIGVIIASNRIRTDNAAVKNFEDGGFATGMLVNINNSDYPLNNQEYNILHLNPNEMILSYQGPFWGNNNTATVSGFYTWAFDLGYGFDNSPYNLTPSVVASYSINTLSTGTYSKDLIYNDSNKSMFILPNDMYNNILKFDVDNNVDSFTVSISSPSIKIVDNKINGRLYALHTTGFMSFDPNSFSVLSSTTLANAYDICVNSDNGDVYVTDNVTNVFVYDSSNTLVATNNSSLLPTFIVYNRFEKVIVYTTDNGTIHEMDGTTRTLSSSQFLSGPVTFLYYNEINGRVYGADGSGTLFSYYNGNLTYTSVLINLTADITISTDLDYMYVYTDMNNLYVLDVNDNIVSEMTLSTYGYVGYNNYDRKVYITSNPNVLVYDIYLNSVVATLSTTGFYSKLEFDWGNNSMYSISPINNNVIQINTNLPFIPFTFSNATYSIASDQYYGSLDPNYTFIDDIWLNTREFIRKPRYNFLDKGENQISYKWTWLEDTTPEIFLIDFSGEQLSTTGSYVYTGVKPLDKIYLNTEPNKDITKVGLPEYQQTVFNSITNQLSYIDSEDDISFVPSPLQAFIGFMSEEEGVLSSTLLLKKVEDVTLDIFVNDSNYNIITFTNVTDTINGDYGIIELNVSSTDMFANNNLREEQIIKISLKDNQNEFGQYVSKNNGKVFRIRNVYSRQIIVDYISDVLVNESNVINDFPVNLLTTAINVTYLDFNITVQERELASVQIYGQTEIEDIRFKINLNNVGHNLMPEDAFIFKHHPIDEQGVDWNILNNKRKEMLLSLGDIFNYIGSYKSIINAINLFGYNDLELYEYYKNININSSNYGKLIKVEIPDIFDNTVEGWTEKNFLKIHLPNENFDETNLFNLTYKITDKDGNFVLGYSVEEAFTKLAGLKKWLHKNVIPLTHKILDITGRADFVQTNYITHQVFDVSILNIHNNITPVVGQITESYTLPVNSGSTVYNVVVEFSRNDGNNKPDYYNVVIKTYQNYPEWDVFKTYQVGDFVRYYDLLYVSVLTNNKLNNPRKYLTTESWSANIDYLFGQIVEYNRRIYQYAVEIPKPDYMVDTLDILNDPEDLIIDNGKIYLVNQGVDKLTVIDVVTYLVLDTVSVNNSPIKLLKNNINGYIYILGIMDMAVYNPTTGTVITTINFSFSTTDDFVINQISGSIYVPLVNNDIVIINSSNNIIGTITLSNITNNMLWNSVDNKIYAGLADGTTISLIDSSSDTFLFDVAAGFDSTNGIEIKYNNINDNVYYLDSSLRLYKINNLTFNQVYSNAVYDFVIDSSTGNIYLSDTLGNIVIIDPTDNILSTTNISIYGLIQIDESSKVVYVSDSLSTKVVVFDAKTLSTNRITNINDTATKMIFDNTSNSLYGLINSTDNIFRIKLKNASNPPYLNNDWNDITEWEKVDLKPIQVIKEYRDGDNLLPFNFTVDSNIDPFIVLSITSDNGYGQIYTDRKSYELYISEDASANIRSTDYVQDSNP